MTRAFWKTKPLERLSRSEWESLCDGCGKCCLHKLEDADTGEVFYTNVACRLLDLESVRCARYAERRRWVPDCTVLTPGQIKNFHWLPETCGYRRVAEGRDLPDWHPLVTGDPESPHKAGMSIRGRALSERAVGDLEDHLLEREP